MTLRYVFVLPAALTLSVLAGCVSATTAVQASPPLPPTEATPPPPQAQAMSGQASSASEVAKEMVEFVARVEGYQALRQQLTANVPPLSDKAAPAELDGFQRALAALIVAARSEAKPGDIFVPDMQTVVRRLMARVFSTPTQRADLQATMADENPTGVTVVVNTRYPEGLALATMSPDVLKNLPPLPKELEYRFVGESLILLDTRAYLVVDVMSFAVPRK